MKLKLNLLGLTLVPSPRGEGCLEYCSENRFQFISTLLIGFLLFILFPKFIFAQKQDTLYTVNVIALAEKNKVATPTPVQTINATQLAKINSQNVADAVKYLAGVQVKDYGGVGGLKTISVRSLGANHTGILYDGIAINDAQGGQIDLGKFSLDNIEQIQLYNSSPTEILLPANAFNTASIITLKSSSAIINTVEKQTLKIRLQQGSFGYFSPSLSLKKRIGNKIQMAFVAWYQSATNQYPYNSYETDSTIENRKNSNINAYRLEYDAAFIKNDSNKIKLKTYFYKSKRGLPGSIILYNNTSNQRLEDENFFTQTNWQRKIKTKQHLLLSAKYSYTKTYYLDPAYPNSYGKLENEFHQQELYLSAAYKYEILKKLNIAFASDVSKAKLQRTDIFAANFANPRRNTLLNNIAVNYKNSKLEIAANLLHTSITENVQNGLSGSKLSKITPAASISIKPFGNKQFYLRAFYKNIFRAPTFNDLYYTNIGNVNLKPEFANQINLGATFAKNNLAFFNRIECTADAYLNNVTNKILAVPRQNLFQWSMQNIGSVKIKGLDATLHAIFNEWKNIKMSSSIAYTFQQALDLSDKTTPAYKTQLPYTPMHSGSINVSLEYKNYAFNYNFIGASLRYRQGDLLPENALNPWASHDVSAAYSFKNNYKIILAANNILNKQYEIIKYYPMPKFNYTITFITDFKNKN